MEKEIKTTVAKSVSSVKTIGTARCSAWSDTPGECRIQVRDPKLKRKLERIDNAKLVAWDVAGGYLRIYAFQKPLSWARNWIKRNVYTNEAFSRPESLTANEAALDGSQLHQLPNRPITEIVAQKIALAA